MTYNVLMGTLNPTHSLNSTELAWWLSRWCHSYDCDVVVWRIIIIIIIIQKPENIYMSPLGEGGGILCRLNYRPDSVL